MVSVTSLPWFLGYSRLCSEDSWASSRSQEREVADEGHCIGLGMQHKPRPVLTLAKAAIVSRFSNSFPDPNPQDIVQAGFGFTMQP